MARTKRQLQGEVHLGHQADRFLDDPQFVQAVEDAKTSIFNAWVHSQPLQVAERESLWMQWHNLELLVNLLRKPISEATLAAKELNQNNYQHRMEQL